ncbi:MAG TPA: HNH endonuclease [Streptosporangiaceae bacterium]|nr:HNH endonuclease [Streptosporangiaceae bacterium]
MPEAIASRITVDPIAGCWRVAGNLYKGGYARIGGEGAHRVVYQLLVGPIPEGLVLDHVKARGCGTNACAWPMHLEPVPPVVNVMRGNSPHAINARKDRCDNGHEFDLVNTYFYTTKGGGVRRECRICIRDRVRRYKELNREAVNASRKRRREHQRLAGGAADGTAALFPVPALKGAA